MLPMTPQVHYDSGIPLSTVHIREFYVWHMHVEILVHEVKLTNVYYLQPYSRHKQFFNDMYMFFKNAFFLYYAWAQMFFTSNKSANVTLNLLQTYRYFLIACSCGHPNDASSLIKGSLLSKWWSSVGFSWKDIITKWNPVWKQTICGLFQNEFKKVKWCMVIWSNEKWSAQRRNGLVKGEMILSKMK